MIQHLLVNCLAKRGNQKKKVIMRKVDQIVIKRKKAKRMGMLRRDRKHLMETRKLKNKIAMVPTVTRVTTIRKKDQ